MSGPGFNLTLVKSARRSERNSPARQARSWKTNPAVGFPLSYRSFNASALAAALRATLMESVPMERIPLSLSLLRTLSLSDRSFGDAHGIRSRGTDSPYPRPYCAPSPCQTALWARCKGKDRPEGRSFHERPLAAEYCATCGSRFHFCFG